ncbi:MAG: DnaD domain protein [Coprobacillus sp.]
MDELLNYNCIDFKKLLMIKAKSLKITDQECYVLLLIMTMNEIGLKPITPANISKLCSLTIKKIDEVLISLVDKHMISRNKGKLDLESLYIKLLNQSEKEEVKDIDLVSVFENAFGRTLNQMELEIINTFKSSGYDDQMILDALNESVKSGVINFRYIEKILDNWSKYGVKRRYAPANQTSQNQEIEQDIKDYKWWLDNE